ncbi:hypothetical protein [Streptomyces sp. H39-S7]|uniref:hypothetical protein n=1 Tax=Streptomyces sp. H39-S7 TaxID=3004357 RepID=UPI002F3610DA
MTQTNAPLVRIRWQVSHGPAVRAVEVDRGRPPPAGDGQHRDRTHSPAELSTWKAVCDALFFLFNAVIAVLALGLAVRIRRSQLSVLRERAARLEIEREQRSKLAFAEERTRVAARCTTSSAITLPS